MRTARTRTWPSLGHSSVRNHYGPYRVPIDTTEDGCESVRRVYIETLEDRALTPGFQASMYADRPCDAVYSLEIGHSSFFAAPDALVDRLLSM